MAATSPPPPAASAASVAVVAAAAAAASASAATAQPLILFRHIWVHASGGSGSSSGGSNNSSGATGSNNGGGSGGIDVLHPVFSKKKDIGKGKQPLAKIIVKESSTLMIELAFTVEQASESLTFVAQMYKQNDEPIHSYLERMGTFEPSEKQYRYRVRDSNAVNVMSHARSSYVCKIRICREDGGRDYLTVSCVFRATKSGMLSSFLKDPEQEDDDKEDELAQMHPSASGWSTIPKQLIPSNSGDVEEEKAPMGRRKTIFGNRPAGEIARELGYWLYTTNVGQYFVKFGADRTGEDVRSSFPCSTIWMFGIPYVFPEPPSDSSDMLYVDDLNPISTSSSSLHGVKSRKNTKTVRRTLNHQGKLGSADQEDFTLRGSWGKPSEKGLNLKRYGNLGDAYGVRMVMSFPSFEQQHRQALLGWLQSHQYAITRGNDPSNVEAEEAVAKSVNGRVLFVHIHIEPERQYQILSINIFAGIRATSSLSSLLSYGMSVALGHSYLTPQMERIIRFSCRLRAFLRQTCGVDDFIFAEGYNIDVSRLEAAYTNDEFKRRPSDIPKPDISSISSSISSGSSSASGAPASGEAKDGADPSFAADPKAAAACSSPEPMASPEDQSAKNALLTVESAMNNTSSQLGHSRSTVDLLRRSDTKSPFVSGVLSRWTHRPTSGMWVPYEVTLQDGILTSRPGATAPVRGHKRSFSGVSEQEMDSASLPLALAVVILHTDGSFRFDVHFNSVIYCLKCDSQGSFDEWCESLKQEAGVVKVAVDDDSDLDVVHSSSIPSTPFGLAPSTPATISSSSSPSSLSPQPGEEAFTMVNLSSSDDESDNEFDHVPSPRKVSSVVEAPALTPTPLTPMPALTPTPTPTPTPMPLSGPAPQPLEVPTININDDEKLVVVHSNSVTELETSDSAAQDSGFSPNYQTLVRFLQDFHSRFWFTYRKDFPRIEPSFFTTDLGWGCMLRTGQMMLAQAFSQIMLTRTWRLHDNQSIHQLASYKKLLGWFEDTNSPSAIYSIHNMALMGSHLNKKVGEWFGPATVAFVLKRLIESHKESPLTVYLDLEGVIYRDKVTSIATSGGGGWKPVILFLPIRLGIDEINPIYYSDLKSLFQIPESVGIAGGKPCKSLYFTACQDDEFFYLDPHILRPYLSLKDVELFPVEEYHCDVVRSVPVARLDPSMLLGFVCASQDSFESLCKSMSRMPQNQRICSVLDRAPDYYEDGYDTVDDSTTVSASAS